MKWRLSNISGRTPWVVGFGLVCMCFWALSGCGGGGGGTRASAPVASQLTTLAQLGERIFHDPSLSASGRLACANCHEQQHGFAQASSVPKGGIDLQQPGSRNAPSLAYLAENPTFYFDNEGTPTGGFNRDGRANDLAEQAIRPFLNPIEMANDSSADVVARLRVATYAADFRSVFGEQIFSDVGRAFLAAREALQAYEREDADFAPFSSKYDAFLANRTSLSDAELRGLALFNNPSKGNCAACHPSGRREGGKPPLFTDFTYDNVGVPRNDDIPANADPAYFDLGLCGPFREDLATHTDLCGAFKVPTLRNIALTAPYFHNGRFQTLREVVSFYVRRDTNPQEWYPLNADGSVRKFDDLPAQYASNVNASEAPYNRQQGDEPALAMNEIDDVVAFLQTLTDGYTP